MQWLNEIEQAMKDGRITEAGWRYEVGPKLIAAVKVTQKALKDISKQSAGGWIDVPVYSPFDALADCQHIADKALAQLQSGEFGEGDE
ncbi:hypothetical protein [Alicyclobacillus shizuokensis]|uniref:hypothetical protein n=1 Tax=Alicyclobacillus shizuokensis TaxID=392014 RepID=UPI00082953C7|nr:hypothetical protein [Alicyclobacillus shizuokensis]